MESHAAATTTTTRTQVHTSVRRRATVSPNRYLPPLPPPLPPTNNSNKRSHMRVPSPNRSAHRPLLRKLFPLWFRRYSLVVGIVGFQLVWYWTWLSLDYHQQQHQKSSDGSWILDKRVLEHETYPLASSSLSSLPSLRKKSPYQDNNSLRVNHHRQHLHQYTPNLEQRKQLLHRRLERLERTKPPVAPSGTDSPRREPNPFVSGPILDPWEELTVDLESSTRDHRDCPASIPANATILITNIATSPLAAATALYVARHCHVGELLGTDDLFPNIQRYRALHPMQRFLSVLYKNIPQFRFIQTDKGLYRAANNDESMSKDATWWTRRQPQFDVLLHVETSRPYYNATYFTPQTYQRYATEQSRWTYEHVLQIAKIHQNVKIVHVVSHHNDYINVSNKQSSRVPNALWAPLSRAATMDTTTATGMSTMRTLALPPVYGPPFGTAGQDDAGHRDSPFSPLSTPPTISSVQKAMVFCQDAVQAILHVLDDTDESSTSVAVDPDENVVLARYSLHPKHVTTSNSGVPLKAGAPSDFRHVQLATFQERSKYPYGRGMPSDGVSPLVSVDSGYLDTYGLRRQQQSLSCASQCIPRDEKSAQFQSAPCQASVWEDLLPKTQQATAGYRLVTYVVHLETKLTTLAQPEASPPNSKMENNTFCRVAIVSRHSALMKQLLHEHKQRHTAAAPNSYKEPAVFHHHGWNLFWVNATDQTVTDSDYSLPLIDPSRFFAPSVLKAMWLDYQSTRNSLVPTSDFRLAVLMYNVDRPASGPHKEMESRRGSTIRRQIVVPAKPARKAILFTGQASSGKNRGLPNTVAQFAQHRGMTAAIHKRMLEWHELYQSTVQTKRLRPNFREGLHRIPYEWTSTSIVVHDLQLPEARDLRCEWLTEVSTPFRGDRASSIPEDLGLAVVLGRRRIEGKLLMHEDDVANDSKNPMEWIHLAKTGDDNTMNNDADEILVKNKAEITLRVMPRKK